MKDNYLVHKWLSMNKKMDHVWTYLFLYLLSISFTVTDWMIGIFTLSDFIFLTILILMMATGNYIVKKKQVFISLAFLLGVFFNIFLSNRYNENFQFSTGLAGLIKISFYLVTTVGLYNFIKKKELEKETLIAINVVAILVSLIGIYITIAIYSNGKLPFDFFWVFTRKDRLSYSFNWNENLIRSRSIFSEPSYFGYYLNIILGVNYFNKVGSNISKWMNMLLTIMIILTFSYSSIAIMLIIQILKGFEFVKNRNFEWNKFYYIYFFVLFIVVFLFWDTFSETLLKRTVAIFSGEDTSAIKRITSSWQYTSKEHPLLGNGIGHTPPIWNIYAYLLSDFGLIAFLFSIVFTGYIMFNNIKIGTLFLLLNFQKGGYLSNSFWIFLLLIFLFMNSRGRQEDNKMYKH